MDDKREAHRLKLLKRMRLDWAPSQVCRYQRNKAQNSDIFHLQDVPHDYEELRPVSIKSYYNWDYKLHQTGKIWRVNTFCNTRAFIE